MSDGVSSPISAYLNSKRVEEAELERALLAEWVQLKPGVPRKFLQAMAAIGFPMSKVGIYRSDCEMVAVSDMWTKAVPHFLATLKGMRLQVGAASTSRPGESFYHAPNTTSSHALEVKEFIGFGPYAFVRGWTAFYRDAADVVSLADSIMNPSEAVMPLTYAAPDGAYLITVQLLFGNMTMNVRIHRKRPT